MLSSLPSGHNFKVFADKFLTSLILLDVPKERAGTIRTNRLNKCLLLGEKDLRKDSRGSYGYHTDTYSSLIVV